MKTNHTMGQYSSDNFFLVAVFFRAAFDARPLSIHVFAGVGNREPPVTLRAAENGIVEARTELIVVVVAVHVEAFEDERQRLARSFKLTRNLDRGGEIIRRAHDKPPGPPR